MQPTGSPRTNKDSNDSSAPNLPETKEPSCGKNEVTELVQDVKDEPEPSSLALAAALERSTAIANNNGQIAQLSSKRLYSPKAYKF